MASKDEKKAPAASPDDEWFPEGATGADDDWMPEGVEGAEDEEAPVLAPDAAQAHRQSGPPQIGRGETFVNRAANAVPLGKPLVDIGATAQMQASPVLGRLLPRALARSLPGVLPGPGATLTPQARAELQAMGEEVPQEETPLSALDAYRQQRDRREERNELGSEQHPWMARLGTATGIGLSALAPLPAAKGAAGAGAGVLKRALAGARAGVLTGAGYGALTGLTEGNHDLTRPSLGEFAQAGANTVMGAGIGAGIGGTLGGVLPLATAFYQGVVKPTAAAAMLRAKGVPVTTGQMNPEGKLAQFEESSTAIGGIGKEIEKQRDAARTGWQNAVLDEARPPGMDRLDSSLPIPERLAQAYEGFNAAYAPARGVMVEPRTPGGVPLVPPTPAPLPPATPPPAPTTGPQMPGFPLTAPTPTPAPTSVLPLARDAKGRFLKRGQQPPAAPAPTAPSPASAPQQPTPPPQKGVFETTVDDPSVLATADERAVVKRFLDNELTLVEKAAEQGKVASDLLLQMRHNIRAKLAETERSQKFPQAQLLERAERQVTDILEASLPKEAVSALRAADAQYARYKPVESAVAKSGDQSGGFTPAQLSAAIRAETEKGAYARGAGGEMRDLAAAGREVLESKVPMTGARLLTSAPFLRVPTAMGSYIANLPGPQRFLLGETAPQRFLQSMEATMANALRSPYETGVREFLPQGSRPAFATEEQERQRALAEALGRTTQH
ncbi:hypothetical protein Mx9_p91 [Myxococcus phage Mx9]|nr:hypothetical protein Mx9_p91 [Myxococcus phage Mx9]